MIQVLVAVSSGILAVSYFQYLPPLWIAGLLLAFALLLMLGRKYWRKNPLLRFSSLCHLGAGFLLGLCYGVASGHGLLASQLDARLEGVELMIAGRVLGVPQGDDRRQRFRLLVNYVGSELLSHSSNEGSIESSGVPRKVLLSWYYGPEIVSGQALKVRVKLKRPRGFVNPGGFDYQAWLLRQGVGATGYVRKSGDNQLLSEEAYSALLTAPETIPQKSMVLLSSVRHYFLSWLQQSMPEGRERGVLIALLIGERLEIEPEQWSLLQATGTNHLVAISGLHIALLAMLGHVVGAVLGRLVNLCISRVPAPLVASVMSIGLATIYSALAGFNLPTVRALIMVVAVQIALLARRPQAAVVSLVWALLVVLVVDPLAGHDLGFWLSFSAVGGLLFAFGGRLNAQPMLKSRKMKLRFIRAQLVVFIALFFPLLLLVQSVPLIGPVTNFVAIPLVSFLVLPALLLAAVVQVCAAPLASYCLFVADVGVKLLWRWLEWVYQYSHELNWSGAGNADTSVWLLGLALVGVMLLLMPRGIPGRWLGLVLVLPLVFPVDDFAVNDLTESDGLTPALRLTVLDVGQGLAVVVEAPGGKTLVYDVGPAFSDKFNAGADIVIPYLKSRGIKSVDTLVLSHGDKDHAGGLVGVMDNIEVDRLLVGGSTLPAFQEDPFRGHERVEDCLRGVGWQWQDVGFTILSPYKPSGGSGSLSRIDTSNNRSCSLLITYRHQHLLLPGDIEVEVERYLLDAGGLPQNIDLLLAPHHGSNTSSSDSFVRHVRPRYVVYSAGYGSRYGHPHRRVRDRYQAVGSQALSTATSGAITFVLQKNGKWLVEERRVLQKRYWFTDLSMNKS